MAAGDHTVVGTMTANKVAVTDTVVVANLNADQVDGADKDTDVALAANSDAKVPSQKAVKAYIDAADALKADDDAVVHDTGAEAVAGVKTFSDGIVGDVTGKADEADGVVETGASITLKLKVIEIGDWDMDFTKTVQVAHGLTIAKIRSLDVMIRNDPDTSHFPLNYPEQINYTDTQGSFRADAVNIVMSRTANGIFDDVVFDSTDYNRGWITIWYEV